MNKSSIQKVNGGMLAALTTRQWSIVALIVAALALMYFDAMGALSRRWDQDSNYGHGYIVPLVSLYLAWQSLGRLKADELRRETPSGGVIVGSLLILAGVLLSCLTLVMASVIAGGVSLVLILSGLTVLLGGWVWWKRLWAPILFLLFMIPVPSAVYSKIAFPLQLFVSQVSAMTLEVCNVPVMRDGNLLHLPGQTMHVAEACSGLRQLMAFLAVCACAALIMERPNWYRWLLFLSSIPIALIVNIIRVTGTGMLIHMGHLDWTLGWMHTAEGLIMVGIGLGFVMLEISIIDWLLVDDAPKQAPALPLPASPAARTVKTQSAYRQETAVA